MHTYSRSQRRRSGFTVTEILVAISILAVLASLGAGVYIRARSSGVDAKAKAELQSLHAAMEEFKNWHGQYPPSRLKIARLKTGYDLTQKLDKESFKFLTSGVFANCAKRYNATQPVEWVDIGGTPWTSFILEGDQVLVFCLGGIPKISGGTASCTGFSKNTENPGDTTASVARTAPFFNFASNRLVARHLNNPFPSYLDTYGQPGLETGRVILYFSSPYNQFFNSPGGSDCTNLPIGPGAFGPVFPYANRLGTGLPDYHLNTGFQLICAGKDGFFGQGTGITSITATATAGSPVWSATSPSNIGYGKDDLSNFTSGKLGR